MRSFVKFGSVTVDPSRHAGKYDESDDEDWRSFRYFGLFASFCALGFTSVAVANKNWLVGKGYNAGLWDNCVYNMTQNRTAQNCYDSKTSWQCGVIGLLLFTIIFGFLATILSTLGVCASAIYMKMYYYHSAGEMYLVCAICSVISLIIYPIAMTIDRRALHQSYGAGYCLAWLADGFFTSAAASMCIDELFHWWRSRFPRRPRHKLPHQSSPQYYRSVGSPQHQRHDQSIIDGDRV